MNPDRLKEFRLVLEAAGLRADTIAPDGALHLCRSSEVQRGEYCAYILHAGPPVSGGWKNFQTGDSGRWASPDLHALPHDDRMLVMKRHGKDRELLSRQEETIHAQMRKRALTIFDAAGKPSQNHPYLVRKDVPPLGDIRMARDGRLVMPIHNPMGHLQSLQFISGEGEKRFLSGGAVHGNFFQIPGDEDEALCIVQDYASGATIRLATGKTVWAALDPRNLIAVAQKARERHPGRDIIFCLAADHGCNASQSSFPDICEIRSACGRIGARILFPIFRDRAGKSTFNDLALSEGLEAVRLCFAGTTIQDRQVTVSKETPAQTSLTAFRLTDFLAYDFPKYDYIMDPILTTQGLAMLYAPRGLGKTFLALSIGYAVSDGLPLLRFKTPKPRRVLFVDGEMQGWMMKERLSGIVRRYGSEAPSNDFFQIVSPDLTPDIMPNLATSEGQARLEPCLSGVELLVLDNLATLCRYGKENEAESWRPVQEWLLSLRRRGISVLVVHHSGKNGGQRGT